MVEAWQIPTTAQIFAMRDAALLAQQQADQLQTKSIVLGYNVGHSVAIEGGNDKPPEITFRVWRFDEDRQHAGQWFSSVPEVEAHLKELARLPRWCLDLVGNVTVRVVTEDNIPFTVFTDTRTGQEFYVRTVVDLEAITVLPIHAETAPTVGDSRLDPPTAG